MNLTQLGSIALIATSLFAAACAASPQQRTAWTAAAGVERLGARVGQTAPLASFRGDGNTCQNTGDCTLGGGGHLVLNGSFHLNPGIAILRAKDAGGGVFWVGLVSPTDRVGAAAIMTMGPADSAGWVQVDGGDYSVAISAYGGYQITVEQPDANAPVTAQRSFSGTGLQVLPFMQLSAGTYTLTATSSSDLSLALVDLNGDRVAAADGSAGPNLLLNHSNGPVSKTFTVLLDGLYMLATQTSDFPNGNNVTWNVAIN